MIISLRRKYMTVNYALPSSATTTHCVSGVVCWLYHSTASLIARPVQDLSSFQNCIHRFVLMPPSLTILGLLHILCSMIANDQSIQYDRL